MLDTGDQSETDYHTTATSTTAPSYLIIIPAMQAVRKQAADPAMKARTATWAMWPRLAGAM